MNYLKIFCPEGEQMSDMKAVIPSLKSAGTETILRIARALRTLGPVGTMLPLLTSRRRRLSGLAKQSPNPQVLVL